LLLPFAPAFARATDSRVNAAFLSRLATAANKGDVESLKVLTLPEAQADFRWTVEPTGMFGKRRPWQVKQLELPGFEERESGVFVAFTRYNFCESTGDHLYRVAFTPSGPRLREEIPETETGGYRVRDHKLTVRFDIPRCRVFLTDRVTIERQANAMPAVILRINAIYTVTAVKREGKPVPFRQAGGFLAIRPPDADRATYDLAYHGTVRNSDEDFILRNEAALTSYWYPHTARLPATSEVRIDVPRGWTAIGQGEFLGKSAAGRRVIFAWKNRLPVCYLTVAAGRYAVTTRNIGGIRVSAYLLRPNARRARAAIETAGRAIRWFSKQFSSYPYSRYAVVESNVFPPALECYSFTLAGRSMIPMAIPHEVAHTWWGGLVPNTYTRTLWNESFAEYSDGLYGRKTGALGMREYSPRMVAMLGPLFSQASLIEARNVMDPGHVAIGYGKGGLVLETLERLLGAETMLACMRRFLARHRPGEAAEWQDFVDAVAETAGAEWRDFFPPWLTRTDLPDLRLKDVKTDREGGRRFVTGIIAQNEPAFWLRVPLVVRTEEGETRREIAVKSAAVPFRIEVDANPLQIALDPRNEALRAIFKQEPPSLLALQTSGAPLLVVYATGGTPEENAAVKTVASTQTRGLFPFAAITVKADTEVSEAGLSAANVLLLGRPENFRGLPNAWRDALPLRCAGEEIVIGEKRWKGRDLWGFAILAHPSRPKGLLAHAVGVSPEAIRNFLYQGDLDAQKGLFIVRGMGKSVAAQSSANPDPTVAPLTP